MKILIPPESIAARVTELGKDIARDYAGRTLVLVCVLKGGFVFAADLARATGLPIRVEFMRAKSYGDATVSPGKVRITSEPDVLLTGRDVLLVEDVVDTGHTMSHLLDALRAHKPASLKVCALLHKPARAVIPVAIDYLGFTIEDEFVVGYGLDQGGLWRNLPFVGVP